MKMLTSEIKNLLDKLYNLRGEESVVLIKMEKEKEKAEDTKKKTTEMKANLQDKIEMLTKEEKTLADEGERLKNALSTIKTEDFKTVLEKLNLDFDPDKISQKVSDTLPNTIDKVVNEAKKAKEELVSVEDEMNKAITTIEELGIRKNEALANQKRLNEYFELALDGNINITRDSITSLLKEFDFNENEQREAAKILMFPEDALFEYDKKFKDSQNTGKSISEVLEEAKVVSENKKLSPKEELIEILKELGFDYLEFTNNDIAKILANYDEDTLKSNVLYAEKNNINKILFVDNIELLYDKEFKNKLDKLIEIGKEPNDVFLNPRVLIKYTKEELNTAINKLVDGGLDPKIVPLIAY